MARLRMTFTAREQGDMAKILVVDDYIDTVESMTLWLEHFGHDVQTARDGGQALDVAAEAASGLRAARPRPARHGRL